jgi:biotin synthase
MTEDLYSQPIINADHASIRRLLDLSLPDETRQLFQDARRLKQQTVGSRVYLRGIVEFSNICDKDCYYCGIRKSNNNAERFQMPEDEIVAVSIEAYRKGIGSIVLQAGERINKEYTAMVERIVRRIKEDSNGGIGITLSLGEQNQDTYHRWFQAGAHRYLLRIETSNRILYEKVHPGDHDYTVRLQCLKNLREIGYQVGSGVLIGMPGETTEDLADDALFFRKIDLDMIGMGPYVVHSRTPLAEKAENYDRDRQLNLGLKMIAVCRLLMPDINIAATTALQTLSPIGWELGIMSGANVVMPNITPAKYRKAYTLYQGKSICQESEAPLKYLRRLFKNIGEEIVPDQWGDSLHFKKRT